MIRFIFWPALALCLSACASVPDPASTSGGDLRQRMERADLALREARLIDAEILYRDLTRTHPNLPDVWLRLGNIYVRQGQLEAADRAYRDGMRHAGDDGRLWFNLAVVQLRQAAETLELASEVLPTDSPSRAAIAQLHRDLLMLSARPAGAETSAGDSAP